MFPESTLTSFALSPFSSSHLVSPPSFQLFKLETFRVTLKSFLPLSPNFHQEIPVDLVLTWTSEMNHFSPLHRLWFESNRHLLEESVLPELSAPLLPVERILTAAVGVKIRSNDGSVRTRQRTPASCRVTATALTRAHETQGGPVPVPASSCFLCPAMQAS